MSANSPPSFPDKMQTTSQYMGKSSSFCSCCGNCSQLNRRHASQPSHQYYQRQGSRTMCSNRPCRTLLLATVSAVLFSILLLPAHAQLQVTLGPLKEEEPSNYYVGNIASATGLSRKLSNSEFRRLQFSIMDSTQLFSINKNSGALFTRQMIDREEICGDSNECIQEFDVTVKSDDKFFNMVSVRVNITDINDNRPKFPGEEEIIVDIPENSEGGFTKLLPTANDPDIGQNSVQQYFLLQPMEP